MNILWQVNDKFQISQSIPRQRLWWRFNYTVWLISDKISSFLRRTNSSQALKRNYYWLVISLYRFELESAKEILLGISTNFEFEFVTMMIIWAILIKFFENFQWKRLRFLRKSHKKVWRNFLLISVIFTRNSVRHFHKIRL